MKKVIPIIIMSALLFVACSTCEASIMSRLCSSFTNVLDGEETKAAAAVKNCKKNCAMIQKKYDLIKAAQKKVDDSCAKGITPDITKVSAGLDKNVQAKLRKQYNQHSKMYDGKADLPDKDFGLTTKFNQSPGLTVGKGGQVADLKTSEPAIPKLNTASEFSLTGKSPTLLASAKSALLPQKVSAVMAAGDWTDVNCVCSDGRKLGKMSVDQCVKRCKSTPKPPTPAPGWDDLIPTYGEFVDILKDIGNDIKKLYKDAKTVITNPGEFAKALWGETKKIAQDLWKGIKPPLKLAWDAAIYPIKFTFDVAGGATDMLSNYLTYKQVNEEMVKADQPTYNLDKYFHCVANCQAARRGVGGKTAAVVISEVRELGDEYIKGDSRELCDEDRAANKVGREGDKNLSCRVVCKSYRPPALDPKY